MKKMKAIGIGVLGIFALAQFVRPEKNISETVSEHDLASRVETPANIRTILQQSCYDCHSNNTRYPWYAEIQPVGWLLRRDVDEGKKHFNFSEFGAGSLRRQFHKLEEIEEQVAGDEMPPVAYQWMHEKLTADQKSALVAWSVQAREEMKNKYPLDSLMRRR